MPHIKVRNSVSDSTEDIRLSEPLSTPEAREARCIDLAVQLAEKQLVEGTASSQVITHFLKLATAKEQLEQEKLRLEEELLIAKTKAIESGQYTEELYSEAIQAMKRYKGDI